MSTYDRTLADTQRAIIEAAERRGYERALSEQPPAGEAVAWPMCKAGHKDYVAGCTGCADLLPLKTLGTTPQAAQVQQIDRRRFEEAPCYMCGYNGEGYYQPGTHECASLYHAHRVAHPAADALGAVRETCPPWGTPQACDFLLARALKAESAIAQAPVVWVMGEMANLRSAIMRLDGQSRLDTLVAYRKLEAALGQGKENG